MDFFDEPKEYRSGRRPDRCYSNCNPETRLGRLEGFYQYKEYGPRGDSQSKLVSDALEKWAEQQARLVYQGCLFIYHSPQVSCRQDCGRNLRDMHRQFYASMISGRSWAHGVGPTHMSRNSSMLYGVRIATATILRHRERPSGQFPGMLGGHLGERLE
ncbi:hypothetical protein VTN31DRAFT_3061 [Thermomyces dupontii]|uniref:uncharacterized protein n=1 Tax=Talaromyces thermophilus TaxID=28565 RepID=UPI00374301B0